jgi:transposase-like protein
LKLFSGVPDAASSIFVPAGVPAADGRAGSIRANLRLRQERDILSKAAAWFARESKANPNGFS